MEIKFNINPKKLKEEDRRMLIGEKSSRIAHDDQMLMNNQTRLFAIFVMFIAIIPIIMLLSLPDLVKWILAIIAFEITIYAIWHTFKFRKNFQKDRGKAEKSREELLAHHFKYTLKEDK